MASVRSGREAEKKRSSALDPQELKWGGGDADDGGGGARVRTRLAEMRERRDFVGLASVYVLCRRTRV